MPHQPFTPDSFATFGDLLKYLRRRERLTQLELSIAVGYSEAQITPTGKESAPARSHGTQGAVYSGVASRK